MLPRHSRKAKLLKLEHIFATQYISQWLDKTVLQAGAHKVGLREELTALRGMEPLSAKKLRQHIDTNWERWGWSANDRRRWKRAAVLILKQL